MAKICGIYTITNLVNGKIYVGRSVDVFDRLIHHKSELKCNRHYNKHLQDAYNEYGVENFVFELLEEHFSKVLPSMENWWCNMLNTHDRKYGYNIDKTGPNSKMGPSKEMIEKLRNIKLTEAQKENLRIKNTGKKYSEETNKKKGKPGINNPFYGRHHTLENKIKRAREVYQYSLEEEYIGEFYSIKEAENQTGVLATSIIACCKERYHTAGGFIWKYK